MAGSHQTPQSPEFTTVLVTGGTGYIAQFCILALLAKNYKVRTTLRTPSRQAEVLANLKTGGAEPGDRLSFVIANLSSDEGWVEAAKGCTYVLHGASPTPTGEHVTPDDWINPAVEGNLRILRASKEAGVRRVVLTSAFGAIGMGHRPVGRPFDERDWSVVENGVGPYQKSKTLSERAAWDFVKREGGGTELAAINPVAVTGPVLGQDFSHSSRLIKTMLEGQLGCPRVNSGFVDVRDVADLHVLAMENRAAAGERFLAISGESLWLVGVARILKRRMGDHGTKVSTRQLPDWFIRLAAMGSPALKGVVPFLGENLNATSEKAKRLLGWSPMSAEESIVATAESFVRLGLLNKSSLEKE